VSRRDVDVVALVKWRLIVSMHDAILPRCHSLFTRLAPRESPEIRMSPICRFTYRPRTVSAIYESRYSLRECDDTFMLIVNHAFMRDTHVRNIWRILYLPYTVYIEN